MHKELLQTVRNPNLDTSANTDESPIRDHVQEEKAGDQKPRNTASASQNRGKPSRERESRNP